MTAPILSETMYDSVNMADIPKDAKNVAYYPRFSNPDVVNAMFPNAQKFAITQEMPPNWQQSRVGDFELDALTWQSARDFLVARERFRPGTATAYASYDNLPLLKKGMGVLDFTPWIWVALWPAFPTANEIGVVNQAVEKIGGKLAAIQYFNDQTRNYDISLKNPAWRHHS